MPYPIRTAPDNLGSHQQLASQGNRKRNAVRARGLSQQVRRDRRRPSTGRYPVYLISWRSRAFMNLVGKDLFPGCLPFDDVCESYFRPSILEKEQFNFELQNSELHLHPGRIPNRVPGEQ
jgi:hypothetical protein